MPKNYALLEIIRAQQARANRAARGPAAAAAAAAAGALPVSRPGANVAPAVPDIVSLSAVLRLAALTATIFGAEYVFAARDESHEEAFIAALTLAALAVLGQIAASVYLRMPQHRWPLSLGSLARCFAFVLTSFWLFVCSTKLVWRGVVLFVLRLDGGKPVPGACEQSISAVNRATKRAWWYCLRAEEFSSGLRLDRFLSTGVPSQPIVLALLLTFALFLCARFWERMRRPVLATLVPLLPALAAFAIATNAFSLV